MLALAQALLPGRGRRVLVWISALACLGLIIGTGVSVVQHSLRQADALAITSGSVLPSLALDLIVLVVALGFWAVALWSVYLGQLIPPVCFLMGAGTLASGLLSALESDWGSRLFYVLMAWCSPTLFALHYELISRPPARPVRAALWTSLGLASLCSLPPLL